VNCFSAFDKYVADTGNRFDLRNETGRYADILINRQIRKMHPDVVFLLKDDKVRNVF